MGFSFKELNWSSIPLSYSTMPSKWWLVPCCLELQPFWPKGLRSRSRKGPLVPPSSRWVGCEIQLNLHLEQESSWINLDIINLKICIFAILHIASVYSYRVYIYICAYILGGGLFSLCFKQMHRVSHTFELSHPFHQWKTCGWTHGHPMPPNATKLTETHGSHSNPHWPKAIPQAKCDAFSTIKFEEKKADTDLLPVIFQDGWYCSHSKSPEDQLQRSWTYWNQFMLPHTCVQWP